MRFLDFIGSSALSSILLFYLTEWFELNSLNNRVTPPTVQHLALVLLAVHNSISLFHAYTFLNWALYIIHFVGLLLHTLFIISYNKISIHRKLFPMQVLCGACLTAFAFAYVFSSDDAAARKARLEALSHLAGGVAVFAVPALSLRLAVKHDDGNCISVWITASLLWSASLAFLYGFLIKDNVMQISQIPCIAVCLASMGFVWHQDKKRMEELRVLLDEKSKGEKDK